MALLRKVAQWKGRQSVSNAWSAFGRNTVWTALATLGVALAGCTAPAAGPAPAGGDDMGPATPKVQRVVLALNPPPTESNDIRKICCFDIGAMRPMYENLVGYDESGKFVPQLAESWSLEPDGESFRFKLRRGVQFNRGYGELTARDVEFSVKDLVDNIPNSYALATWWRQTSKSFEILNDYEFIWHLNPNSAFMEYMSEAGGMMPIRSKAQREREGEPGDNPAKPVAGTGPYDFVERQIGGYIRYARASDKHWRVTPDFPELEFRWSREASTRLASLLAGEAHITTLSDDLMPQAERAGMKVIRGMVPGTRAWGTWVCCARTDSGEYYRDNTSPLLNVKVRQALNKAIDRNALQKAFFQRGERMVINHMHPSWPGWDPSWDRRFNDLYGYDPEAARRLLAEAGYGPNNPLKTNVAIRPSVVIPNAPDVAEAIAGYWRAVGADVTIVQQDTATQTAEIRAYKWTNHFYIDASSTHQVSAWPNRASDIQAFPSRGTASYFDADTNRLNTELERTLDERRQADLMRQLGELMFTRFGSVPLFFVPVEAIVNPQIIAAWPFPGPSFGTWTRTEYIRAAT